MMMRVVAANGLAFAGVLLLAMYMIDTAELSVVIRAPLQLNSMTATGTIQGTVSGSQESASFAGVDVGASAQAEPQSSASAASGGTAVPGCPKGGYMDASRRKRAEDALAEHFQR